MTSDEVLANLEGLAEVQGDVREAVELIRRLRDALAYYADRSNYVLGTDGIHSDVELDEGAIAREALGLHGE